MKILSRLCTYCGRLFLSLLCLLVCGPLLPGQQPFVTDDADTTQKGRIHLEVINEFDRLPATSLPLSYQNGTRVTLAYGLWRNLEVSVTGQFLTLVSREGPQQVGGLGDTTIAVKYNFLQERENSWRPALTVSGYLQIPTGDTTRSLGSGIYDYGVTGVAQKTIGAKNLFRINGGIIFSGNTATGALGLTARRGRVYPGAASYVRTINDRLQLGAEIAGAVPSNLQLSRGQLQTQVGGNYQLTQATTFDFGVIIGRYAASPRVGFLVGFSHDF